MHPINRDRQKSHPFNTEMDKAAMQAAARYVTPSFQLPVLPTEAEFVRCGRLVKELLETMRSEFSCSLKVERMRRTRTGWAVIYQLGDQPRGAFKIDVRGGEPRSLSPEQAIRQWIRAS